MSNGLALSTEFLPLPVDPGPQLNNAVPSVQSHYRTFHPTTNCSAPVPRIGTLALAVLAAWTSPLASDDRFSRSVQEPDPTSRRLYAGCRSGSLQARSRAYPGSKTLPRFRHHLMHFDRSSTVCLRSPLRIAPAGIESRLLLQRSPRPLLTTAACSGLRPTPDCRPRGARPHLLYSSTSLTRGMLS